MLINCPKCGNVLSGTEKFCPLCGTNLEEVVDTTPKSDFYEPVKVERSNDIRPKCETKQKEERIPEKDLQRLLREESVPKQFCVALLNMIMFYGLFISSFVWGILLGTYVSLVRSTGSLIAPISELRLICAADGVWIKNCYDYILDDIISADGFFNAVINMIIVGGCIVVFGAPIYNLCLLISKKILFSKVRNRHFDYSKSVTRIKKDYNKKIRNAKSREQVIFNRLAMEYFLSEKHRGVELLCDIILTVLDFVLSLTPFMFIILFFISSVLNVKNPDIIAFVPVVICIAARVAADIIIKTNRKSRTISYLKMCEEEKLIDTSIDFEKEDAIIESHKINEMIGASTIRAISYILMVLTMVAFIVWYKP